MHDEVRTQTLDEIRNERVRVCEILNKQGIDAYPARTGRTHEIAQVKADFETLVQQETSVIVAGRVMAIREHGGSIFIDLFDGTGSIQGYVKKDTMPAQTFDLFLETIDRGDFIEFSGICFLTKRGEPSVLISTWTMLTKSLAPLPTEHFGIKNEEERFRKRYLDILLDKDLAARVRRRSHFWNTIRSFLLERGYIEVETPVLETMPGGAEARPFTTHHNALDMDVYLRISAGELWQKKLMVAGIPKTFEIGRIFRNEGMSFEHLQDYTQLEFYEAYSDFEKGKELIKELYRTVAQTVFGTTKFTAREHTFDLSETWVTYDFSAIIKDTYGIDPRDASEELIVKAVADAGIAYDYSKQLNKERGADLLWKKCRTKLSGPGFLVNVPVYLEPLAKRSSTDPRVVERFQVILAGSEVGKGFSELNDPRDQEERFAHQEDLRASGDDEAQFADREYVEALEYGMPPTFGFGVSERLFSFFEGVPIREGQLFPLLKPRQ